MNNIQQSYDEYPYKSYAHADSSIYKLEGIATFLGLSPVPINQARVLEIGCSSGGNLATSALENPNAQFVGLDLSNTQIQLGKNAIEKIGIKNLLLIQQDVLELAEKIKYGSTPPHQIFQQKFDYIITHGVYSWVPDEVKEAILFLSSELLSPNGIAYISYNTYPGWKNKEIIRDLMLYASENEKDPIKKLDVAETALTNYINTIKDIDDKAVPLLCLNAQSALDNPNKAYILHEYLAQYNDPCYLRDFVRKVRQYNLDYLVDALMLPSYNTRSQFIDGQDRVEREQLGDFLCNRIFRASLLTPKSNVGLAKDALNFTFTKANLDKLEFYGQFKVENGIIKDISGNTTFPENFANITQEFSENYPNSITTQYLINKYPEQKDEIYNQLIQLIAYASIGFTVHKLEEIKYEVGKTRLKTGYINYFNYFATEENSNLMPANMLNFSLNLTPSHAKFAAMFDGKNSVDDIVNAVKAFMTEQDQYFTVNRPDGSEQKIVEQTEIDKTCYTFINEIKTKLEQSYFFERI